MQAMNRIRRSIILIPARMLQYRPLCRTSPDFPRTPSGNKIFYDSNNSHKLTVKLMFGSGCFNFFYWSYYLTTSFAYKDVVIQGVDLGGDPRWGYFGAFATGLIFYATRQFAHHTVRLAYESSDCQRIGFEMHNILGGDLYFLSLSI